jgi:hypothetical protein
MYSRRDVSETARTAGGGLVPNRTDNSPMVQGGECKEPPGRISRRSPCLPSSRPHSGGSPERGKRCTNLCRPNGPETLVYFFCSCASVGGTSPVPTNAKDPGS